MSKDDKSRHWAVQELAPTFQLPVQRLQLGLRQSVRRFHLVPVSLRVAQLVLGPLQLTLCLALGL